MVPLFDSTCRTLILRVNHAVRNTTHLNEQPMILRTIKKTFTSQLKFTNHAQAALEQYRDTPVHIQNAIYVLRCRVNFEAIHLLGSDH